MNNSTQALTRREIGAFSLLLGVFLAVVYRAPLSQCYGYQDDYVHLYLIGAGRADEFRLFIAMGRPVYGWLSQWLFAAAESTCNLGAIRAISVFGVGVFLVLFYRCVRLAGWPRVLAGCIAIGVATLPAFSLYVAWAVMFQLGFALALALLAGELVFRGLDRSAAMPAPSVLFGTALLLLSLTLYQHASTVYWLYLAILVASPYRLHRLDLRRVFAFGAVFGIVMASYFVAYKVLLEWLMAADPLYRQMAFRAEIASDLHTKMVFFGRQLVLAASPGGFVGNPLLATAVLLLAVIGLAWTFTRDTVAAACWILIVLTINLPSLMVNESLLKIRLLGPLASVLLLYAFCGLALLPRLSGKAGRPWLQLCFIAIALCSSVAAKYNIERYFVAPQLAEKELIEAQLSVGITELALVKPPYVNLIDGIPPETEYGTVSTTMPAPGGAMILLHLYRERFGGRPDVTIHQCPEPERGDKCATLTARPELPRIDIMAGMSPL